MTKLTETQKLIDETRANAEYDRAPSYSKFDWIQYGSRRLDDGYDLVVEIYVNGLKNNPDENHVARTNFWQGSQRISRALAEELLNA